MSVLFCDSNCELWYDILESNGVKLIKMPYQLDGDEYYYDCGKDTDFKHFYKRLREKGMPTTTALKVNDYLTYFEPYFKAGEDILYISFSTKMSPTFEALKIAIKELRAKYPNASFMRFDTFNISLGAGILVYHAIKYQEYGLTSARIIEQLTNLRDKVATYFVVDDLNHLKRGGRLSGAAAFMGTLLNKKPVLTVNDGSLVAVEKITGRRAAIKDLLNKYDLLRDKDHKEVWIVGADCPEDVNSVAGEIKGKYGNGVDIKKQPVGPVVSAHCGPDTLGIIFIKK